MPPLIWREKVFLCPVCWSKTDPDEPFCRHCGEEFTPEGGKEEAGRSGLGGDALAAFSLALTVISSALLAILISIDQLHRFVIPLHQNWAIYLIPAIVAIAIGILGYKMNRRRFETGPGWSRIKRVSPASLMSIAGVFVVSIAMSKQLDAILTESRWQLLAGISAMLVLGIVLLVVSTYAIGRVGRRAKCD